IAVPFLVLSGVMLDRVRTAEFGFPTDGLAAARLPAPVGPEREAGFSIRRVRDNLQQASGVRSVALAEGMPIDFDYRLFRVGRKDGAEFVTAQVTRVDENFLETIGAPLGRGRMITAEDRMMAAPVAVISEPLAKQLFPATEAIGEQVTVTLEEDALVLVRPARVLDEESREQEFTIVGVSADFATSQLTTERPQILLPLPDLSTGASAKAEALPRTMHLIARGAPGDEPKLKAALETALRELGVEALPGVAFPGIVTGQDLVEKSLGDLISESMAVGFAGGLVLILAALGIVGVVGFMVATRTRELAVRMALGSTRRGVFGLMLSDIVKLVIPGVAGGLLLAAVLIRTMEDVMGTPLTVGPTPLGVMEPLIYVLASAIAVSVALLAGLPAARRATVVQPMVAIRSE
ncbi:MAG: ABC transporter permease, partial [Vicinamibacterales bacterium]